MSPHRSLIFLLCIYSEFTLAKSVGGVEPELAIIKYQMAAVEKGAAIPVLTPHLIFQLLGTDLRYGVIRSIREQIKPYLRAGQLPPGSKIELIQSKIDSSWNTFLRIPALTQHFVYQSSDGTKYELFLPDRFQIAEGPKTGDVATSAERDTCSEVVPQGSLCEEPFRSELPPMTSMSFPKNIEMKITPIQIRGQPRLGLTARSRDALRVQFQVTTRNIWDLAAYFSVGYSNADILKKLQTKLGNGDDVWIDLQDIFPNWVSMRANSYPVVGENEVCHASAREFFFDKESPESSYNARSTQAVIALLSRSYCPLADGVEPRFGDYLWWPNTHSARYIVRDRVTGRDVVFSIQSGGGVPFRFYWMDEDFSGSPFDHTPSSQLRSRYVDIWRRCHPNPPK